MKAFFVPAVFVLCLVPLLLPAAGIGGPGGTLSLVTLESPPAEFTRKGRATGRNVEIARECLRRMGRPCRVLIIPWQRALVMVETGSADGIIDAAYTAERAAFLYYPREPIYVEKWYGFRRKGTRVSFDRGLVNAGQVTLGVTRGFECGGIIQEAVDGGWFKNIHLGESNEMNIHKLIAERFDAFVGVDVTIGYYSRQMGVGDQVEPVPMTESGNPYLLSTSNTFVAFSKKTTSPGFTKRFSNTLKAMKADGTTGRISSRFH